MCVTAASVRVMVRVAGDVGLIESASARRVRECGAGAVACSVTCVLCVAACHIFILKQQYAHQLTLHSFKGAQPFEMNHFLD